MKRRTKNRDISRKIIKGMTKNKEKIERDWFGQRLRENFLRNKSKDTIMTLELFTDYLNNGSSNRSKVSYGTVEKQYAEWSTRSYEEINVANKVIDRMLYKGIERLDKLLSYNSSDPQSQVFKLENKEKKVEKILHWSDEIKQDKEEEKLENIVQPDLRKIHSQNSPESNRTYLIKRELELISEEKVMSNDQGESGRESETVSGINTEEKEKSAFKILETKPEDDDTDEEFIEYPQK